MVHTTLFDTLQYTETLVESGFSPQQAKAQAMALFKLYNAANLVTQSDLERLEMKLDSRS